MKSLKLFSLLALTLAGAFSVQAQDKKEVIAVNGNCGMCKTNIEKAARSAGATDAQWDASSKSLSVTYSSATSNAGKIQQSVAAAGYDTRDVKATDAAYDKLHGCCKYDRQKAGSAVKACEMKDGKCVGEAQCMEKGCCKSKAECADKGCCGKQDVSAACTKACDHKEHTTSSGAATKAAKSCCAAH